MNVAVIGLGNMGTFHATKYASLPEVNFVAICDTSQTENKLAFGEITVPVYNSLNAMLSDHHIDAVSIASPTFTHYNVAKFCLEKGIHCLIEKPIATTAQEAEELIHLAKEKKLVLTVGHIERFNPAVLKVKECINKGMLGDISSVSFRRNGPFPPQIDDADVVIDLAVHDIDIANYWLGALPDTITGHKAALITGGRPDHAEILAKYGSTHVFFQVNWVTPTRVRTAVLTGSKGYIEMDFISKSIKYYESKAEFSNNRHGETIAKFQAVESQDIEVELQDSLEEQLRCFVGAIMKNNPLLVTPSQARDALELALKI